MERPMPCKTLLALPLLGAYVLFLTAAASPYACSSPAPPAAPAVSLPQMLGAYVPSLTASLAPDACSSPALPAAPAACLPQSPCVPNPPPGPSACPADACQSRTHTMTIYNGDQVQQQTFVWRHGSWRSYAGADHCDASFRDAPCSPQRYYGAYRSPCHPEKAACSVRANRNLTCARPHCP
jgi:hypothetical protein